MTPLHLTFFLAVCTACLTIFMMILNDVFNEQDRRRREEEFWQHQMRRRAR